MSDVETAPGTPVADPGPSPRRLRLPFSPWHLVLLPLTFVLVVPLLWMLVTSLQTPGEANRFPPVLLPHHPRLANYADAWHTAPFGTLFLNSTLVTLVVVVKAPPLECVTNRSPERSPAACQPGWAPSSVKAISPSAGLGSR